MTLRVKICGLRSPEEAVLAISAGADAVGINLVGGPRRVDPALAEAIAAAIVPPVLPVVLVRIQDGGLADEQRRWLARRRISHLQLYGDVTPEAVGRLVDEGFRPILVTPVRSEAFAAEIGAFLRRCGHRPPAALLLDAYVPGKAGGTGKTFEWGWVKDARSSGQTAGWPPVILAGGLTPGNVARAIREATPDAVDVASGVEADGRKNETMMRTFVAAARAALTTEA